MKRRLAIRVEGIVQGVGFRPAVWRIATGLGLSGWVCNTGEGVRIEAEGDVAGLDQLIGLLWQIPFPAQIRALHHEWRDPQQDAGFTILASRHSGKGANIGADLAPCPACLDEIFDPLSRRWRYAFTNCTHCGPRYTITKSLPYERAATSMAGFPFCPDCAAEYANPADRRFHAEPIACPCCGPVLDLQLANGCSLAGDQQALAASLALLQQGRIVAIKGVGGFHLCCDARNHEAIRRLRERKPRARKPLALMAANLASLYPELMISEEEATWLQSPQRPIVLLSRRPGGTLPGLLAPGLNTLGLMLPYSPLHYLLFHTAAGEPAGTAWQDLPQDLLLVMTSANPSGAPVLINNTEAQEQLAHIADAFLLNNRDIVARNDDSVLRVRSDGSACFLRRGRGFSPLPLLIPAGLPVTLALGAELKNTLCLAGDGLAHLSPHIGDLDDPRSCRALTQLAQLLPVRLGLQPERIVCDAHPDFYSTRLAAELVAQTGAKVIQVQHHHAHIAAVQAEYGVDGPLLGLALDGYGYGQDGGHWGGELLRAERQHCVRLGSLAPLALAGGERAGREPWRLAAAILIRLGRAAEIVPRFSGEPAAAFVARQTSALVMSSSLARLMEAAAALLGVCYRQDYEAEAVQLLESLCQPCAPLTGGWLINAVGQLDFLPLFARLADETHPQRGASLLHATLAAGLAGWVIQAAQQQNLQTVALGGGCWANRFLDEQVSRYLQTAGLTVLRAGVVPPGDGGLSLGQAWVAMYDEED